MKKWIQVCNIVRICLNYNINLTLLVQYKLIIFLKINIIYIKMYSIPNHSPFHFQVLNENIISNVMCYTMLYMLEWMRKRKYRIGTL